METAWEEMQPRPTWSLSWGQRKAAGLEVTRAFTHGDEAVFVCSLRCSLGLSTVTDTIDNV